MELLEQMVILFLIGGISGCGRKSSLGSAATQHPGVRGAARISCALSTLIVTLLTWASQPPRGLLLSQFLLDHEVLQALRPLIHRVCAACLVHVCALVLVKSVNIVLAVMQEQCALG